MKSHRIVTSFVALSILSALSACSSAREALIPSKKAPDEFAVYSRTPLSVPPDFTLRVPEPGSERPEGVTPSDTAQQALLGGNDQSSTMQTTPGIQALLRDTKALEADPSIRKLVNQETSILSEEDKTVTEQILFWGADSTYGTEVDPTEENKRIQENQALGQPLTSGDTPTIAKKTKGLLEDIF